MTMFVILFKHQNLFLWLVWAHYIFPKFPMKESQSQLEFYF